MSQHNTPSVLCFWYKSFWYKSFGYKKPQNILVLLQSAGFLLSFLFFSQVQAHAEKTADFSLTDLPVADLRRAPSLQGILEQIHDARVLLVGETHTRYDHHLVQLEVLKHLYQSRQNVVLGVEWFQQPFQQPLDDYIAGKITEAEMLERTEYFRRWRFDYRLYRPVIQYAREKHIPVIALNASQELTAALGHAGFEQLPDELRSQLPERYDFSDSDYIDRLSHIFDQHPDKSRKFANFLMVQITWDESMAERAAEYLLQHPDATMLVLAGSGHISYGSGIPNRIKRRLNSKQFSILVSDDSISMSREMADFLVLSHHQSLQPAGLLGIFLESTDGRVVIQDFMPDSPLKSAGIEKGSMIVGINDKAVNNYTDLKLALIDHLQGDTVEVHYLQKGNSRKSIKIILQ